MKYRKVDKNVLIVIILTIIAATIALAVPSNVLPIRILTLPFVLVLPGYALTSALFPQHSFGVYEHLLFSLGLSLIIVILGGLVLNWTPFGLRANSWAVYLAGITLGACAVALMRHRRKNLNFSRVTRSGNIGLTFRQGFLLSLAVLIVCGTIIASIIGALQQTHPGFTQLWILPTSGTNPNHVIQLGVGNKESVALNYSLDVNVNGKIVQKWPSIYLRPNEKWQTTLVLPSTMNTIGALKVEAMLYRTDAPTKAYRNVVLWIGT